MGKTALIAGASGLIGKELLTFLLNGNEYEKVIALVRSPLHINHPKLQKQVVNFGELDSHHELFENVDDVFCCLGTTIKKAKSRMAMKKVDVDYPVMIGKLARAMGATQYLVVSSLGADPNSLVWYSKMKGMLEKELKGLSYDSLQIFRPSLLLGQRNEYRFGETIAASIYPVMTPILVGCLKKYRAIPGKDVAFAMYQAAKSPKKGTTIYLSDRIAEMAK
jgi:uncharacterized protein YbjT (DUF2867 family)